MNPSSLQSRSHFSSQSHKRHLDLLLLSSRQASTRKDGVPSWIAATLICKCFWPQQPKFDLTTDTFCRKLVKVFSYTCVIFAEFSLIRYFLWLKAGGRAPPSAEADKDWDTRLRKMGAGLSNARMSLRLASWLTGIKFCLEQLRKFMAGEKLASRKEYLRALLNLVGGISGDWRYLCKVSRTLWVIDTRCDVL